jgi:hypothetical protein
MNERIRQLAEQADNYAEQTVHYYNGQFEGLTWEGKLNQVRDTKFAELIVKECMEQVWYTREDGINGNVSEVIKDRIKQHFGFKEMPSKNPIDTFASLRELIGNQLSNQDAIELATFLRRE